MSYVLVAIDEMKKSLREEIVMQGMQFERKTDALRTQMFSVASIVSNSWRQISHEMEALIMVNEDATIHHVKEPILDPCQDKKVGASKVMQTLQTLRIGKLHAS